MNKLRLLSGIILSVLIFFSLFQYALAGQNNVIPFKFTTKGEIGPNSPLEGKRIWTIIDGQKGTVLFQGLKGLAIVRLSLSENSNCDVINIVCLDATVTDVKNADVIKMGDTGRIDINLNDRQENMTGFSGLVQGSELRVNIAQTWVTPTGVYSLILDRTGGFAGISKKIEINSQDGTIMVTNRTNSSAFVFDVASNEKIKLAILKSKFFDISTKNYPPIPGSADYFVYSLEIKQGPFSNKVDWTDTSSDVPQSLVGLRDIISDVANNSNIPYSTQSSSGQAGLDTIQVTIAKDFVISSPTFKFDGMPDSIKVGKVLVQESAPQQFIVPINFTSTHGGYGDRTGQFVTQSLTPHIVMVTIVDNKVTLAIMDKVWNELNQTLIK